MKVSIAMATYNGAKFLPEQLQSFIDQTHQPDEVVITDDCSTDNTVKIIESFVKRAPFKVKFLRNAENLGYAGNFNAALMQTTGDLVFLSDQDDVWFSNKIEYMINLAVEHPNYYVYMNDALLTDEKLNSANLTKYGQLKSAGRSDEAFVMGCCCAIRRDYLDFILPIPTGLKAHDNWLVEIAGGLRVKLIDSTVLQYYRRHGNNESQFLANRLTKVSKISNLVLAFKSVFNANNHADLSSSIENRRLFISGLEKTLPKVPSPYEQHFKNLIKNRRSKLSLLKVRAAVRKMNIFRRLYKTLKLYKHGYPKKTRLRNMIRDVLG